MKIKTVMVIAGLAWSAPSPTFAQAEASQPEAQSMASDPASLFRESLRNYDAALELMSASRFLEALPLAQRALELSERSVGPDASQTLAAVNLLGGLNRELGRYPDAEHFYQRVHRAMLRQFGDEHVNTRSAADSLAEVYTLQGRRLEAFRLRGIPDDGIVRIPPPPPRSLSGGN